MASLSVSTLSVIVVALAIVLCYHVYIAYQVHRNPELTFIGNNLRTKQQFVLQLLASKKPIEGVQIFRNSMLIATVFITISSLAIVFLVPVLFVPKRVQDTVDASAVYSLDFLPPMDSASLRFVAAVLTANFVIMLMNSVQSCRFLLHATFAVIGMEADEAPTLVEILMRSHLHFSVSQRCIFNVLPLGLCFFGASWGLVGSVVVVMLLYYLDHPYAFKHAQRVMPLSQLMEVPGH